MNRYFIVEEDIQSFPMHTQRSQRPRLHIPQRKDVEFEQSPSITGGYLSPDLSPSTPPQFPTNDPPQGLSKIGHYILETPLETQGQEEIYKAFHKHTLEEFVCKVVPLEKYQESVTAYYRIGSHDHINDIRQIIHGSTKAYIFFGQHYGDLHTYVRTKKRLREVEAARLFSQIVAAVAKCHESGVVLRDLKLRKFAFKDTERMQLKLVGLEDAHVLDDHLDDSMIDKHGCPAYVSPEILNPNKSYSGKAADVWSLGVMLYTMLVGRYPFHDRDPTALFMKIRRGEFTIPDTVTSRPKCLLRNLLRREPSERLSAEEILQHPWFHCLQRSSGYGFSKTDSKNNTDQLVPNFEQEQTEDFFV